MSVKVTKSRIFQAHHANTNFVRLYYIFGTFRMQNREKLSPTLCFAGSRQAVVRMPSSNFSLQSLAAIYRALQNIVWTMYTSKG